MSSGASSAPAVDRGAVRQLEDQLGREGLAGLIAMFIERTPGRLANLRRAVEADDASAAREAAHSLKGTARSFGGAEMGELAARIEQGAQAGSLEGADPLVDELEAAFERTRAELEQQLWPKGAPGPAGSIRVLPADDDPVIRELAPPSPAERLAQLEQRLAALERSVAALLARSVV